MTVLFAAGIAQIRFALYSLLTADVPYRAQRQNGSSEAFCTGLTVTLVHAILTARSEEDDLRRMTCKTFSPAQVVLPTPPPPPPYPPPPPLCAILSMIA